MKKISLLSLLSVMALWAMADTGLPPKCEAFMPKAFLNKTIKESDAKSVMNTSSHGQDGGSSNLKFWTVWSDRDDNTTYNGPSTSSGKAGSLAFNEQVRIAKVSGDFALVYTEPQPSVKYPLISREAKSRGWVPLSNLLLWESCPTNEKGIYYKALLVANLDKARQGDQSLGRLYKNPATKANATVLTSDDKFYFIMKRVGNLVLLARQYTMIGQSDKVLLGWVSESSVVPWNQRSCLEPNWDPEVAETFKQNGVQATVYSSPAKSQSVAKIPYGRANGEDNKQSSKYRMAGSSRRYPILDNDSKNSNLFKCTTFATASGKVINNNVEKKVQSELDKLSQCNLMIVIDGTTSMGQYYPAVKNAIKEGCKYFGENEKVKVGLVIYRDYADGDGLVEYLPLTSPTDPRLSSMLDSGGKYGIKSSPNDHTHTEALYKGIETALDRTKMGYDPKQANLIMVVGDCGNAEDDSRCMSKQQLIRKLIDNNIQLMSYQVRRKNSHAWEIFNDQLSDMVLANLDGQYQRLGNIKASFKPAKRGNDPVGYDSKPRGGASEFFVGSMRFAPVNSEMNPQELSALMRKGFETFQDAIGVQKDVLVMFGNSQSQENTGSVIDQQFVISRVGKETWEEIKKTNTIMSFSGYTEKTDPSGRDYWKPIIFISTSELDELIMRLDPVNKAAKQGNRKPYVDAMKALIRSMLPDITTQEMNEMTVQEIMNVVSGLNASSQALSGPSLVQIQDPKAVSDQDFMGLVNRFSKKYAQLQKIKADNQYIYFTNFNNAKYYWIPIEDLP